MRVRINTMVDIDMQKQFRAAEAVHGKTIADALELGMIAILKDIDSVAVIEIDISRKADELEALRKLRAEMCVTAPAQKRIAQFTSSAAEIEKARWATWELEKERLRKELRRGDVNWNRILWDYRFESRREALAWFRARIDAEKGEKGGGAMS